MSDDLPALADLGVLTASSDPDERRAAAGRLVTALSPVEAHEAVWGRLLRQPGFNRHAALACFASAGASTPGSWRPSDATVRDDWDGIWAVIVQGHEAEGAPDRWLDLLVAEGPAAVASDMVHVVHTVRARIDEQLASGTWVPDPDDPEDGAEPVSADDRTLLGEGAAVLDAWLPTLR